MKNQVDENTDLSTAAVLSPPTALAGVRLGDIFRFHYNQEQSEHLGFSTTHCFEGSLHARETSAGIVLIDTYWGLHGDGRWFTLEEAQNKGTLTFCFNLNDVEPVRDCEQVYYADEDLFTVSEQHACVPRCIRWFKRKGATRNANKMLRVIQERTETRKRDLDYAIHDLDRLVQMEQQVREGNLEVHL